MSSLGEPTFHKKIVTKYQLLKSPIFQVSVSSTFSILMNSIYLLFRSCVIFLGFGIPESVLPTRLNKPLTDLTFV